MKNLFTLLILIVTGSSMNAQIPNSLLESTQDALPNKITSGLYSLTDIPKNNVLFSGSTTHFSDMSFRFETLNKTDGKQKLRMKEEQILIIKEGEAVVSLDKETKTIGPNSVFFLLPGEKGTITSHSQKTTYYRMVYKAANPIKSQNSDQNITSFIIDYEDLAFNESSKGGSRKYFNTSTTMCPYYEMHVTTLNPGMQSHKPHTHEAAEIILMIEGQTEEEIADKSFHGRKGDVYFLASNVPHAIRNIGDKSCQYFAFQWGEK